jgi:hypothetical protein
MSMQKNPLKPSGIEPVTFLFVAQCLNHCATAYPNYLVLVFTQHFIIVIKSRPRFFLLLKFESLLDALEKLRKANLNFFMSVCPHGTTPLTLNRFSWNLIFKYRVYQNDWSGFSLPLRFWKHTQKYVSHMERNSRCSSFVRMPIPLGLWSNTEIMAAP